MKDFNSPFYIVSTAPDQDLVDYIQQKTEVSASLVELISRHSGIYVDMVNTYCGSGPGNQNKQEILQEKDYNIYMAALKYDPNRGTKFSTHLGNETKWICLNYHNKTKVKNRREVEYRDEVAQRPTVHQADVEREDLLQRVHSLIRAHPDERVRKIFHLRYIEGEGNKVMAWERVSQHLSISIQGCINIHNKAVGKIKGQLEQSDA